jgi:crossover junction endodeoxyribonuclease RuvC
MSICLFIDPGIVNLGYSIYDKDEKRILAIGEIVSKQSTTKKKIENIWCKITELVKEHEPNVLVYENPVFTVNHKVGQQLNYVIGILLLISEVHKISEIYCYSPRDIKKKVTGDGKADKLDISKSVADYFQIDNNFSSNHASDSLAIGLTYLKQL